MFLYILLAITLFILIVVLVNYLLDSFKVQNNDLTSVDPHLNGVYYAVSYWTERGGRRYQEDRFSIMKGAGKKDSSLFSVFDGHGGAKASSYCKSHMLNYILSDSYFDSDIVCSLKTAFKKVDIEFETIARRQSLQDGTTAIVAAVHDGIVYVANSGDSRGIIVKEDGSAEAMSIDHKPNREDEARRIQNLGGRIIFWGRWRVEGVLAVSRAIGDVHLKPYVIPDPEVKTRPVSADDHYLVLASDGLWDVMKNSDVAKYIVHSQDFNSVAKELCYEAMVRGSTDNVTVVVVDLRSTQANSVAQEESKQSASSSR